MVTHSTQSRSIPTAIGSQAGISYVELLVAALIIAISVVPIGEALQTSMQVAKSDINATANHYRLLGRLETVMAESFGTLSAAALGPDTETAYSDAPGDPDRIVVYIAEYDIDDADLDDDEFTGVETDMLWIEVEIDDSEQSISTLRTAL